MTDKQTQARNLLQKHGNIAADREYATRLVVELTDAEIERIVAAGGKADAADIVQHIVEAAELRLMQGIGKGVDSAE